MGGISCGEHLRLPVDHGGRRRAVRGCVRAVRGDWKVSNVIKPDNFLHCLLVFLTIVVVCTLYSPFAINRTAARAVVNWQGCCFHV